ncbi:hypothetical protein, partial [Streptococcus pyogenes]|uniref:hypothetical protein n=5 Tax=Streptococcus pyogenes TaxID=1314 RepID=UPI001D14E111
SLFYQVSHSLSTTFSSFFNKCVTGTSLTALLVYDIFTVIVNSFLQFCWKRLKVTDFKSKKDIFTSKLKEDFKILINKILNRG